LIEADFLVSLNGKVGRIQIELIPNDGTEIAIGLAINRVTIEIPYSIPEFEYTNTGYVPPPTSPIKREPYHQSENHKPFYPIPSCRHLRIYDIHTVH
jgi:hypothetical protein